MAARTPYTLCKLFYDGEQPLHVGDYLRTPGGSAYLIQGIRVNRNKAYRKHLNCMRWPLAAIEDDATVHPLHWYPRARRAARSLASLR